MKKDTGGSAFPVSIAADSTGGIWNSHAIEDGCGMTLRDYFAAKAINVASLDSDGTPNGSYFETADGIAVRAYLLADAMLKARSK